MTSTENAKDYRLTNVEAGYAKVIRPVAGQRDRALGSVSQSKHGSTRTGTIWTATTIGGRQVGIAYTRSDAINLLISRR